jgi:amidohydrolase
MTLEVATAPSLVMVLPSNITVPVEDVINWRRHIHQNPELSFQERNTSDYVADLLERFGLEVLRPTETSVVGVLRGTATGAEGSRTVAWRADMDALPIQEETGQPFASVVPGVMQACGHDAHTAMGLGAAKVLSGMRDHIHGTIRFLFQHAEEKNPGGAIQMIEAGAIEGVDAIFGVHVFNQKAGSIFIHKGPSSTAAGAFFCTIQGRGSHGSMPQAAIDPILVASQCVLALNTIVSRNVDPSHLSIVNVGAIHSGEAPNVIPDTAKLAVSLRTTIDEDYQLMAKRCTDIINGICAANGASASFEWTNTYLVLVNDDQLCDLAYEIALGVLPGGAVQWGPGTSGSEDFAQFALVIPGCFLFLGAGDKEDGLYYQNHHPKFNILESCLEAGVKVACALLLGYLEKSST